MIDREWQLVKISSKGLVISYIYFADDILLLARVQTDQAKLMIQVLNDFRAASSHKVIVRKSKAFCSRNVSRRQKDQIVSITSINFCFGLGKYLGIHLFHGIARTLFF